jgi:hypothetical protein
VHMVSGRLTCEASKLGLRRLAVAVSWANTSKRQLRSIDSD